MIALWDTTGNEVLKALATERRTIGGVMSGVALTLVTIVADEAHVAAAEEASAAAAASHPCRLIIVIRDPDLESHGNHPSRLDAEVMVGGRLGSVEAIVMRLHGLLTLHAESLVLPLLAPDVPVVTWWHEPPPDLIAADPLGAMAQRRITDVAQAADPIRALRLRALDYAPGDTDMAWARTTPWRSALAAALDSVAQPVVSATVTAAPTDASGVLLRGWLRARLAIEPTPIDARSGIEALTLSLADGQEVTVERTRDGARVRRTGLPDRLVPLFERTFGEHLAEELRYLDPDSTYAAALEAATGVPGLMSRSPARSALSHEPAQAGRPGPTVVVAQSPDALANDAAARLLLTLRTAQAARGQAAVVLTGGRAATQLYQAVLASPDRDTVDWHAVDIWWGDERFLPAGDPDRNETQARSAFLDALPLDPARVHPMPASDGPDGANADAAATTYVKVLAAVAANELSPAQVPHFDLVLLSIGEDGHIASLFPGHPAVAEHRAAVAVRDSPKPPPIRITLTLPTLNTADEVWIIGSGEEKALPVGLALVGSGPIPLPAASVHGGQRTVWLLDGAAARDLPGTLRDPS